MRILISLLCLLLIGGCDSAEVKEWQTKNGQVIDEMTGQGIADAIVVARWKGTAEYSKTVCFHVESATTDKEGHFEIPAWRNETGWRHTEHQHVAITVYKVGYEDSDKTYKKKSYKEGIYYQKPFVGSADERLEYLMRNSSSIRCGESGVSEIKLLALEKRIFREAKDIYHVNGIGKGKVEILLFGVESLEFGSDEALKRMTERRNLTE
ncbi:MAG: carboxypeptidase-like regulatory domain-containing protein [Pseudomonadota bacterium]